MIFINRLKVAQKNWFYLYRTLNFTKSQVSKRSNFVFYKQKPYFGYRYKPHKEVRSNQNYRKRLPREKPIAIFRKSAFPI